MLAAHHLVEAGVFDPRRRSLSVGLVLTVTLVAFESLAVGTVMPLVARELNGLDLYGWVFSAFFLATLVGIVVAGSVLDRGRLALALSVGLSCFTAGLLVGGLAPSMPVLVAGRVLQGFGAGFEAPVAYAVIGRVYPDDIRPRMFAILSTAWVLPGVIGPAIAGLVGEHLGWRWVFLSIPALITVAAVMTLPALRRLERAPAGGGEPGSAIVPPASTSGTSPDPAADASLPRMPLRRRLPLALAVASGAGLAVAGLDSGAVIPGLPLVAGGLLLGGPAFASLAPPGTLGARPVLPAAVLLRGLLTWAFFAADAYVPLAFVEVRGTSVATAGLVLTASTVTWTAGAWIQERLVGRAGVRRLVGAGFVTVLAGLAITAIVLLPAAPLAVGIVGWGVTGLGMGLAYAPLTLAVLREALPGQVGSASSALQLSDVLGTALGSGLGGALIALAAGPAATATSGAAGQLVDAAAMTTGVAMAFGAGAAAGLVGLSLSGRLSPPESPRAAA